MNTTWGGIVNGAVDEGVTARTLIYQGFRQLGVLLRPGHSASAEAYSDGLVDLNQLIDSWNTERLSIAALERTVYDLTGGESTFVIGDDGARPHKIEAAALIYGEAETEHAIRVHTDGEYHAEPSVTTDRQFPVSTLRISPTPQEGDKIALYTWKPLEQFADLDAAYTLPPGYKLALRLNLAVLMAPAAMTHTKIGAPLLASIEAQARQAKARIQRLNIPTAVMRVDDALLCNHSFDISRGR